jgi:hypothetical protein
MSHVTKNTLKTQLNNTAQGGANQRKAIKNAYNSLVDSLYQVETAHGNTVSESVTVNLSTIQPANSFLEDVIVICTSDASFGSSTLGTLVGTTQNGNDIVGASFSASLEPASSTATTAGVGTSIHPKITTTLEGNSAITLTAGEAYTATERTIYTTVTASGGFNDADGEFTVAMKYIQL